MFLQVMDSFQPAIVKKNCRVRPIVSDTYKMLSYRRDTALQGGLQFSPKVEDWNWETIFHGHCRSIFNHSAYNRLENLWNSVKKNAK